MPAHEAHLHPGTTGWLTIALVLLLVAIATGYCTLAVLRGRDGQGWSGWRTASFVSGIGLLIVALVPQLAPLPAPSFAFHMYQHVLIAMYAPLGLVMGAPVTLFLRSAPHRYARIVGRLLASPVMGVLAHPATALVLNLGGLWLLYLTPLYLATTQSVLLHYLVHAHFLAAGYLFAYAIAGPDPSPHRPSVPVRLVILGCAIAGHAVLSQLLYAGGLVHVRVPAADLRAGADIMYYGGDIAELVLAFAMVTTWRPPRRTPAPPVPSSPRSGCGSSQDDDREVGDEVSDDVHQQTSAP